MFDPTAFENIKVVLEGALYDLDLDGEIIITNRNDWINMAKLSRKFEMDFQLPEKKLVPVTAKIELESNIDNLAAELLTGALSEKLAGCKLNLEFSFSHQHKIVDYRNIEKILLDIWGDNRKIIQAVTFYPLQNEKMMRNVATIIFDRLIYEDQIDDLVDMIDFMKTTLNRLQSIQSI
jgi:hypothetical protein